MSGHWVWCGDEPDPLVGGPPQESFPPFLARGFEEVTNRLDEVAKQLDFLASSQRTVEHFMQQLHRDSTSSPRAHPGVHHQVVQRSSLVTYAVDETGIPYSGTQTPSDPQPPEEPSPLSPRGSRRKSPGKFADAPPDERAEADLLKVRDLPSGGRSDTPKVVAGPGGFWPRKELRELGLKSSAHQIPAYSAPTFTTTSQTKILSVAGERLLRTVHPDSWRRACFDCVIMMTLFYESVMIPYQIAWDLPFEGALATISWISLGIWSVDFLLGFVTGYHEKDRVVTDIPKIIKHYSATYLFPNLLVLAADLTANIVEVTHSGNFQYNNYVKLSRLIKINRVMRMVRMMQTGKVAQAGDWITTSMRQFGLAEEFNFMTRVLKLVIFILWVNHVGSCIWFMTARAAIDEWYKNTLVHDWGQGFEYLLSFYWSASAMIAGESIMVPTKTSEAAVTTFFVLVGFIFSSVLISSLLTTVMEYQDANKERAERVKTLRQFLYQHDVDSAISVPIQAQVNDRILIPKRLSEKDVSALGLLSPVMRSELWHSIYGPSIADDSFIRACNVLQDNFIKDICFSALEHTAHEPGDRIFEPSTEAVGSYFVYWGRLDYLPVAKQTRSQSEIIRTSLIAGKSSMFAESRSGLSDSSYSGSLAVNPGNDDGALQQVRQGKWICPLALWVHWLHRGWLEAAEPCELLTVKSEPFMKVLSNKPDLFAISKDYGKALYAALEREAADELSDIACDIEHLSILSSMPLETRVQFSWAAACVLERKQWTGRLMSQDGYQELTTEIEAGECDLVLEPNDTVYRLVTIAAIQLERQDGAILTQLGKCTKGQTIASCTLPGTKLHIGELPQDAVKRLLQQKLRPYAQAVSLAGRTVDVQEKVSKKFGVSSRYMRTLVVGVMEDSDTAVGIVPLVRRRPSVPSMPSMHPYDSAEQFSTYEAFGFAHEIEEAGTKFIYAWLSPEDNKALTAPGGDALAQKWVSNLQTDVLETGLENVHV